MNEVGRIGEGIACNYLKQKGYKILVRNFHASRYGEIDIVALSNNILVFVEVKSRTTNQYGPPFESITDNKLHKLRRAVNYFLVTYGRKYQEYESLYFIEVIGISMVPGSYAVKNIEHLQLG